MWLRLHIRVVNESCHLDIQRIAIRNSQREVPSLDPSPSVGIREFGVEEIDDSVSSVSQNPELRRRDLPITTTPHQPNLNI